MTTNKQEQLSSKASKCDGSKATAVCKHCNLTLQGSENEGEDICVDCLADLCFPSSYSTIEGCIRQSTDNPIKKEQSSSKASECDESVANKEKEKTDE